MDIINNADNKWPYLSIVLPAHNEAERLPTAINSIVAFSDNYQGPLEVLIVENGSTDKTYAVAIESLLEAQRGCILPFNGRIERIPAAGKGQAVKKGLLEAAGDIVLVSDVDFSTPLSEARRFIGLMEKGKHFIIGSRRLPGSLVTGRSITRAMTGIAFGLLTSTLVPGIRDTQCGFKMMTGPIARRLGRLLTLDGFAYDVELLHLARRLGIDIHEEPVIWVNDENTTIKVFRDSWRMALDVGQIWRNSIRGVYPTSP